MTTKLAVLTLALTAMYSGIGKATTTDLMHSGSWTAFGGTDVAGHEVCGVSTSWDDGRSFLIKRYEGDSYIVVQAINPQWNIKGKEIVISLTMDDNTGWTAHAVVMDDSAGLEFNVPLLKSIDFMKEFSTSNALVLVMGDNNIKWVIDLDGSDTVADKFVDCTKIMSR